MRSKLSHGQRVAITVAWGALLTLVGVLVAPGLSIFGGAGSAAPTGWFAYAPLSNKSGYYPVARPRFGLTSLECFFVWIGLIALWLIVALLVLRSPRDDKQPRES